MSQHSFTLGIILFSIGFCSCEKEFSDDENLSANFIKAEISSLSKLDPNDPAYEEKKAGQVLLSSISEEWIAVEYDSNGKPYILEPCMGESPEIKFYRKDGFVFLNYHTGNEEEEYEVNDFKKLSSQGNKYIAEMDIQFVGGGEYKNVKVIYDSQTSSWVGLDMNTILNFSEKRTAVNYPLVEEFCEE